MTRPGFTPRLVISRSSHGVLTRVAVPLLTFQFDLYPDDLTAWFGVPLPRRADVVVHDVAEGWQVQDRVGNPLQPTRTSIDEAMRGARRLAGDRGGAVWVKAPAPYGLRPDTEQG